MCWIEHCRALAGQDWVGIDIDRLLCKTELSEMEIPMSVSRFAKIPLYALAVVGLGAMTLGAMLATPLKRPPPLASIHAGAGKLDRAGLPDLSRFQARDGTWLAYRLYPAGSDRVAILVHGSSAASYAMNGVAKALAAAGVTAVAIDVRGHGASGERGDIGYVGEIDDDLADLLDALRPTYPNARFDLVGHSLGGGFAARVAGTPLGRRFDRFVLLAPYLGVAAPTNRPNDGKGRWVEARPAAHPGARRAFRVRRDARPIAAGHRLRQRGGVSHGLGLFLPAADRI